MVNWTITATTIYCDATDDEVTLIVHRDGTLNCTGYNKYNKPDKETAIAIKIKGKQLGEQLRCEGLECHRLLQYRNKVLSWEDKEGMVSADSE